MKKIIKICIWLFAIIFALFLVAQILFFSLGKKIIIAQIEQNLKTKASLESVNLSFPLTVNLRGLQIAGLAKVKQVSVSPNILGFFAGKIVLNQLRLDSPEINLRKNPDGSLNLPVLPAGGKPPPIFILGLKVLSGKFSFIDQQIDPAGYRVSVDNINIDIAKNNFPPTSLKVNFELSADLLDTRDNPTGEAKASGWVDWRSKDMEGSISIKDVDVTKILPYLQGVVSSKRLLSARLNFSAEPKAKNNDLIIPCNMELDKVVYQKKEQAEGQPKEIDVVSDTINLFSDETGKMAFKFSYRTKLDKPVFDSRRLESIFAQAALENLTSQPPEKVIEKVKAAVEQFKDLGKSFKKIFSNKE